jgi:hypothetical protein
MLTNHETTFHQTIADCRLHYNTSQHRNDHLSQVLLQEQQQPAVMHPSNRMNLCI